MDRNNGYLRGYTTCYAILIASRHSRVRTAQRTARNLTRSRDVKTLIA